MPHTLDTPDTQIGCRGCRGCGVKNLYDYYSAYARETTAALLRINLFQQAVGMPPLVHHEQHEANVDTNAAGQLRVVEDVG